MISIKSRAGVINGGDSFQEGEQDIYGAESRAQILHIEAPQLNTGNLWEFLSDMQIKRARKAN